MKLLKIEANNLEGRAQYINLSHIIVVAMGNVSERWGIQIELTTNGSLSYRYDTEEEAKTWFNKIIEAIEKS